MTTTPLPRPQTPTVQLVTEAVIAAYIQDLAASARPLTPHARRAGRPTPTSLAQRTLRRNEAVSSRQLARGTQPHTGLALRHTTSRKTRRSTPVSS
ncbi:MAG: hypothetical protein ACLP50_15345 [Solirubrobacteraceae bacterium]